MKPLGTALRALAQGVLWTMVIGASLTWNTHQTRQNTYRIALAEVDLSAKKDILYRHWNAEHGGVYVRVTQDTPPNPYLAHLPERDLTTTDGKKLTLVNPAYMTRQVNELARQEAFATITRLTSLRPVNPQNAPDDYERRALEALEQGADEVASLENDAAGDRVMRLVRPFVTEKTCLKCHERHGFKEGELRGAISVILPVGHLAAIQNNRISWLLFIHALLWLLGISGIGYAAFKMKSAERTRAVLEQARETLIAELKQSLADVKQLQGILPICSSCKKIRDDAGYWHQVDVYISRHTEADFSHGLCEECARKLYPELYQKESGK
jgi:hypothetical protein